MKKYLLFIFILNILITSCNQEYRKNNDLYDYQLKGNIASIKVSVYEADSKFGEIIKKELVYGRTTITDFNESGYITSISEYDEEGSLCHNKVYSYINNKIDYITTHNLISNYVTKAVYNWDNNDLISYIEYDENGKEDFKRVYDYDGKRNKSTSFYSRGELTQKRIITKHDGDFISEEIIYDKNGKKNRILKYEWKDKQIVKHEIISDKNTRFVLYENGLYIMSKDCHYEMYPHKMLWDDYGIFYYEYEYDNKKNWTKCVMYEGEEKEPRHIVEREITYR